MSAATLLRSSRIAAGLTQSQIAATARTSQPAVSEIEASRRDPSVTVLESLLAPTGHRLIAVPTRRSTISETAQALKGALQTPDLPLALRILIQLSDNLIEADDVEAVILCASEPAPTGQAAWDAAIAGLVEYRLEERGLPCPRWTESPRYFLPGAEDFSEAFGGGTVDPDHVPGALSRRGIHIEDRELACA